jgi:hypothetical protein
MEQDCLDGGETVPVTMPDWNSPGAATNNMTAAEVVPAASGTDNPSGPLKWAEEVDTDIEQGTGTEEIQQMIVVPEAPGERIIIPRVELRRSTTLSSRYSSVQCAEDMATLCDGEDGVTAYKNGTLVPRQREKTGDLRRSPKRNKKMKV